MAKQYIPIDSIKIEKEKLLEIRDHCKKHDLNPKHVFIFYENGVKMGFDKDEAKHIVLEDHHWYPAEKA